MTNRRSLPRLLLLACVVTPPAGCARSQNGPTPVVTAVMPALVCDASPGQPMAMLALTIHGSGFSPVVQGALGNSPTAVLPSVTLTASGATPIVIPAGEVSYVSASQLDVSLPLGSLAPTSAAMMQAVYDVTVTNPDGHAGTLPMALTVVPPPTVTGIVPSSGDVGTTVMVAIAGTGFRPGATASLVMGSTSIAVAGATITPTSIAGTVDLTGAPIGVYDVVVTNEPDGCTFTLASAFTVLMPKTLGVSSIEPPFGYMGQETPVTITGSGFVSTPTVTFKPATGSSATASFTLQRVAFVSATTLTAVVPAGEMLGSYDVDIANPPSDGATGTLANAFRVVSQPVPTICSVTPAQGNTQANTPVTITGQNFRATVAVDLIDSAGSVVAGAASGAALSGTGGTTITVTLNTMSVVPVGAYLVRVTDEDQMTYSDFSNFVVTNPSAKLSSWQGATSLVTPRHRLAGTTAEDDLGNRFVYALGGEDASGAPVDSVEVSPLSHFGLLGTFFTNENHLSVKRTGVAAVATAIAPASGTCYPPTSYIYVLGGSSDGASGLASVERALVLRNKDAPVLAAPSTSAAGTLGAGTWYYKVSAVLASTDPENPGETLPSDEAIVTLSAAGGISLSWAKVTVNGVDAASYRVYRTAAVDGSSQSEELLDTTTSLSYTDDGSKSTDATKTFLAEGSLGVFVKFGAGLTTGRFEEQGAIAADASGKPYVFVVGGRTGSAASTIVGSIESAPVNADGTLGTFAAAGTLTTGIANGSLFVETHGNVSTLPSSSGDVLWLWGGEDATGSLVGGGTVSPLQSGSVASGGTVSLVPTSPSGHGSAPKTAAGGFGVAVNDYMFLLGGGTSLSGSQVAASVTGSGQQAPFGTSGLLVGPFSSTSSNFSSCTPSSAECGPRAEGALVVGSGFVYLLGGENDSTSALGSTEQTIE